MLHENNHVNFFLKLGYTLLIVSLLAFTARYGLRWGWPFLVALGLSALIRLPVDFISKKTRLPRGLLAALFTLLILCLGALCVYLISSLLYYRSKALIDALPGLIEQFRGDLSMLETSVDKLLYEIFPMLRDIPFISLEGMLSSSLPQIDVMGIFSTVSSAAGSIPGFLFTIVFIFMATYFFTVQSADIGGFISKNVSPTVLTAIGGLREFLYNSVFKWIKAQLVLMCITFAQLLIAMLLLKESSPVPLAAAIAIVDALPILGVGTVLIPWSLFCLLTGSFEKALWLIVIYIVVLCVRNSLEPKIVGEKIGLNPLITLLSMYVGFRLGGFFGMVFIPIAVLSILKLQELGYIKLWN